MGTPWVSKVPVLRGASVDPWWYSCFCIVPLYIRTLQRVAQASCLGFFDTAVVFPLAHLRICGPRILEKLLVWLRSLVGGSEPQ